MNWKSQSQILLSPYELLVMEAQEAPNVLSIVSTLGCPPGWGHKNLMAEDTTHLGFQGIENESSIWASTLHPAGQFSLCQRLPTGQLEVENASILEFLR